MCSNLGILESVEHWKFGSGYEPGRKLVAGGRDISTGRWPDVIADWEQKRRLEGDCKRGFFFDMRAKILSLSLSAQSPCVPEDEKKPVEYRFTVTPTRCAVPVLILAYSLLVAFVGIYKSHCLSELRRDFWFQPPKPAPPPKSAMEKAKERFQVLKLLCFGAFVSGVLGRAVMPMAVLRPPVTVSRCRLAPYAVGTSPTVLRGAPGSLAALLGGRGVETRA